GLAAVEREGADQHQRLPRERVRLGDLAQLDVSACSGGRRESEHAPDASSLASALARSRQLSAKRATVKAINTGTWTANTTSDSVSTTSGPPLRLLRRNAYSIIPAMIREAISAQRAISKKRVHANPCTRASDARFPASSSADAHSRITAGVSETWLGMCEER